MPTAMPMYQEVFQAIATTCDKCVKGYAIARLALLVVGIINAETCVLHRMACKLATLKLTEAIAESIERRLRRTLSDPHLQVERVYHPLLRQLIAWEELAKQRPVVLVVDESSKEDELHLFRISLTYHGRAVPLAWASWQQNTKLPDGVYWQQVDGVLARVQALLPAGCEVAVVADRAYDVPSFIDRISSRGWHWVVRVKDKGSLRFQDHFRREQALGEWLRVHLPGPSTRWKGRGRAFKAAGWRAVSVVALWAAGYKESLVVFTDYSPRWEVLATYEQRFWTEPAFRDDKKLGWHWEDCHVAGRDHHEHLLLAMAIATLITLCLGVEEGQKRLDRQCHRQPRNPARPGKPRPTKDGLFQLGLLRAQTWLHGNLSTLPALRLVDLGGSTWERIWLAQQCHRYVFSPPVRL